jgi:hypothetical protein
MRHALITIITTTAVAALTLAACEKKSDQPPHTEQVSAANPTASAQGPTHGRPGVQPGSHEDWCGEHEVPESLCTRCNPSLIAAFKATGDWCEEHGLPESQCLVCNPDLEIERPPRTGEASP